MPAKSHQSPPEWWGIWQYKRSLCHRILRFLLLQRWLLFTDLQDSKPFSLTSLCSGSRCLARLNSPADSPLPNRSAPVAIVVSRYPAAIRRTLERALKEQAPLHAADSYCECVSCVGVAHAKTALTESECPRCEDMSLASLRSWMAPPAQSESGFDSRYFLVPKKDGGLWPILDLMPLNSTLMRRTFRMITLKQIFSQICAGDLFFPGDLKDASFHIPPPPPPSQAILEICLWGCGCGGSCPLDCPWLPGTFTKCVDTALSPLRRMGIPHSQLPRWLGCSRPVRGGIVVAQIPPSQPLRVPGTQGQLCKERTVAQPTDIIQFSTRPKGGLRSLK